MSKPEVRRFHKKPSLRGGSEATDEAIQKGGTPRAAFGTRNDKE